MKTYSIANRRAQVSTDTPLSIVRQCELLGVSRSSYYYEPVSETEENLRYMRLIDEQHIKTPYYGVKKMTQHLRNLDYAVNPKRIRRLMRLMGLEALYPKPRTSQPGKGPGHHKLPYLLNGMIIDHPGQVIGADITYIPMRRGFLYLVAFMDWYSRYVLSWELSNSLEQSFCLTALDRVWEQVPVEIINTDQGSQFTSDRFVKTIQDRKPARQSMDGKGRAIDNVFTERLWRSLKYEEVYLHAYEDGTEAWERLTYYLTHYNHQRPHDKLDGRCPIDVWEGKYIAPPIRK